MAGRRAVHWMAIAAGVLAAMPAAAPASEPADAIRYPYVAGLSRVATSPTKEPSTMSGVTQKQM